jgi:hypothetical protein
MFIQYYDITLIITFLLQYNYIFETIIINKSIYKITTILIVAGKISTFKTANTTAIF